MYIYKKKRKYKFCEKKSEINFKKYLIPTISDNKKKPIQIFNEKLNK